MISTLECKASVCATLSYGSVLDFRPLTLRKPTQARHTQLTGHYRPGFRDGLFLLRDSFISVLERSKWEDIWIIHRIYGLYTTLDYSGQEYSDKEFTREKEFM